MKTKKLFWYIHVVIVALFVSSCSSTKEEPKPVVVEEATGQVKINFKLMYKNTLYTNGSEITLPGGEKLTISELKFFLSNIRLVTTDTKEHLSKPVQGDSSQAGIYLFDLAANSGQFTNNITVNLPVGDYADIRYDMMIPSKYNLADISTNPYPVNKGRGMYWSWNSGFKFFVLNGTSPDVPGGNVHLTLGADKLCLYNFKSMLAAQNLNTPKIPVQKGKTTQIDFVFDLGLMFRNTDGSAYRIDPKAVSNPSISPFQVHGGHYSNILRGNIQQAIELENYKILN